MTTGATINAGNIALLGHDVNKDGKINILDLNLMVNNYGIVDSSEIRLAGDNFDEVK